MLTLLAQVADVGSSIAVGGPLAIVLACALVILWKKLEARDAQVELQKKLEAENAELKARVAELQRDATELRGQVDALRKENKDDRAALTERMIGVFQSVQPGGK